MNANPKVFGETGGRSLSIDEDGIVRQNWGPAPAAATSPGIKWKEQGRHTNSTCELGLGHSDLKTIRPAAQRRQAE
ncbi:MAG TPA: hypothetical protein VKB88_41775 [Bryobacteraceae bacterium]|nr:hypothetical protein [Bryobacteraceae bacterium]